MSDMPAYESDEYNSMVEMFKSLTLNDDNKPSTLFSEASWHLRRRAEEAKSSGPDISALRPKSHFVLDSKTLVDLQITSWGRLVEPGFLLLHYSVKYWKATEIRGSATRPVASAFVDSLGFLPTEVPADAQQINVIEHPMSPQPRVIVLDILGQRAWVVLGFSNRNIGGCVTSGPGHAPLHLPRGIQCSRTMESAKPRPSMVLSHVPPFCGIRFPVYKGAGASYALQEAKRT
ncbi:hypothetical protein J3R30DRAFT_3413930 [Lentinula aciculospora]|uniref:Uncharacterized protein n=1 Tax=Lentinula aciculospora TaxID=153920 RepID=A0A9W8ZSD8_9AGAR|nr:hypothetical protein J3R30DRAFT_3413930 [Lentinula aciculospora]